MNCAVDVDSASEDEEHVEAVPAVAAIMRASRAYERQQANAQDREDDAARAVEMKVMEARSRGIMEEHKPVRRVVGLTSGKIGVGKSTLYCCLQGLVGGVPGWYPDGNDLRYVAYNMLDLNVQYQGYDANGFRGDVKLDWFIFLKQLDRIAEVDASIGVVFLVFGSNRFTPAEQCIIDMLVTFTTQAFQDLIQVVITSAPPAVQEHVHPDTGVSMEDCVVHNLSFLGADREAILRRVHYVDLVDPISFQSPAARLEIQEKWAEGQQLMKTIIATSTEQTVLIRDIRKMHWIQELLLIYATEIYIAASLFGLVLCIGIAIWMHVQSLHHQLANRQCSAENDVLKEANKVLSDAAEAAAAHFVAGPSFREKLHHAASSVGGVASSVGEAGVALYEVSIGAAMGAVGSYFW